MGGGDRCSIGVCNNDRRYPENIFVRLHVSNFQFHGLPKDKKLRQIWHDKIRQGRQIILKVPMLKYVPIILRTENVPFGVLSQHCFLTKSDVKTQQSPYKRCQTLRTP
jgi:hypothetical protein